MSSLVTRMLTSLSLVVLLFVAVVVVRVTTWSSEHALVSVSVPDAFFIPTETTVETSNLDQVYAAVALPEFDMPVVSTIARTSKQPRVRFMQVTKEVKILDEVFSPAEAGEVENVDGQWRQLQGSTKVPTDELVVLKPVDMSSALETNFVALMDEIELPGEEKTEIARAPAIEPVEPVEAAPVLDSVSTTMAKSSADSIQVDAEPEFFEIDKKAEAPVAVTEVAPAAVGDTVATQEAEYSIPEGWDLPVGTQKPLHTNTPIKVDNKLVVSGYVAPAGSTRSIQQAPVVAMTTQKNDKLDDYSPTAPQKEDKDEKSTKSTLSLETTQVTIATLAVDIGKRVSPLKGAEIRAKDNDAESWRTSAEEERAGTVVWQEPVAAGTYSRSIVVLHDDYIPTHTDVVMAGKEGLVEIPVLSREKLASFGEIPNGSKPVGALLVELDEATESILVDGEAHKTIRLTENFTATTGEDYRYLLFLGVEAGNRTLTMSLGNQRTFLITHVHAGEVTFDSNLYADPSRLVISLSEEDLLSRKKRPLVVSSDKVEHFFTGEKATKLSTSKYALRRSVLPLGARHYIAATHQGEPVFVGTDGTKAAEVPSESLMREVIRRFRLGGNSQSCIVQVNLDKPAKRYQVISESYGEGQVSYGLALDEDGQFYDSMGEGSRRLFIMSENQSGHPLSENGRVHIRLDYMDGTFRSFHSYCSPNSYLVEQL